MSISSTTRKAGPFTGNGITTVFPFSFKVFTAADLVVVSTTGGVETTLILNSAYSVTLNSNQDTSPGGNVTMFVAPSSSFTITITSAVAQTQPVVLTNNGGFYPTVINNALDRLTILVQQLAEALSRSLKIPISSSNTINGNLPGPVPYKAIGWNGTANGFINLDLSNGAVSTLNNLTGDVVITPNRAGASGAISTYATVQNPQTTEGRKRIIAGRDFGLALDGSTDDAPALNDIIQKVGARGGGYIDIAADMTVGGSAYMKILSSINNNVPGVTIRGTHFPSWGEFRDNAIGNPSGVSIVPGFNGIACYHFTPFSNTAKQITGGGFEYLNVIGGQAGSGSAQDLLRVDGVGRGSYIMNLLYPAGETCARFMARDPALIAPYSNTSIQYAHVDLYCRAYPGFPQHPNANKDAHGVIMQTDSNWTEFGTSGNVSLNQGWRILYEGINGKALWNRSGDANVDFSVLAGQAGEPGISDLIWGSTGTGGTDGTDYDMIFSGGTPISGLTIVPPTGKFTVAGGKITSITFTTHGSGYSKAAAPPTVSFSDCPGLTGASATCVVGVIIYYADAQGKNKASVLGGQSQGFRMLSGGGMPIILEGSNAPSAGALIPIGNGAASTITNAYIDSGNGTPKPTVGTQAFSSVRDGVYAIDWTPKAVGATFGGSQNAAFYGGQQRTASAPFTSTSYETGIAAEFLMDNNTLRLRLEDDSPGVVRLRDANPVPTLTKFAIQTNVQVTGTFEIQPGIGNLYNPSFAGRMTFEATSNTEARIKVMGSDNVVRYARLPLEQFEGSVAFAGATIANGTTGGQSQAIAGIAIGDYVQVSTSFNLANVTLTGYVQATNSVQALFSNTSGASVTLPAGTIYFRITKR